MVRNLTKTSIRRSIIAFIGIFLLFVAGSAALAIDLDPAQEREAGMVLDSLMSPFCPGRLLRDCPSSQAHELKEEIRKKVSEGALAKDLVEYYTTYYGEEFRAAPKNEGFGRLAWLGPLAFLLLGFFFVLIWLKSKRNAEPAANYKQVDDATMAKIEAELKR